MTREQLKAKYPHASESFLRRNATVEADGLRAVPAGSKTAVREVSAVAPSGLTTDEEKLNKTERRWLAVLRGRGYSQVGVHTHTLKLAHDCRYTPDFFTVSGLGMTCWEVKGAHIWEDSLIKIRTAARLFPFYQFVLVQWKDGQWTEKLIKP